MHRIIPSRNRNPSRGQILVLTGVLLTILIGMAALVIDGAGGFVMRRNLQNTADAAAVAAANVLQTGTPRGCSATASPPGAPRASVVAAARASVAANLPGYDPSAVIVTCPSSWRNQAVRVELADRTPSFFGRIWGSSGMDVQARATALNGRNESASFSVVELNPWMPSFPSSRNGCPSVLLSGGPTVILDGAMKINSACTSANGGALATQGNASTLTMNNDSTIQIVGQYKPQALTISPAPIEGVAPAKDPLAGLSDAALDALPVQRDGKTIQNGGVIVLDPGVYRGGIELRSSAVAILRPGVYVLDGGGFSMGAQSSVYSVPAGVSTATVATWPSVCRPTNCGVMFYNKGTTSTMGAFTVAAGATVQVRAYNPDADAGFGAQFEQENYKNVLIWQAASPVPTASYAQPPLLLRGGGTANMTGTVYAPSALVRMGGNSGGSGGDTANLTLQFISWDLEFFGNSSFRFFYVSDMFATPLDYGLVE